MKISTRELGLAWITIVVVILALTYWVGRSRLQQWNDSRRGMAGMKRRMQVTRRLLEQRPKWEGKLDEFRAQLPRYPADERVVSDLLKNLEQTARTHNLTLLKRDPDDEEQLGDLYEVAIHCTWEGDLDALTHFLYDLQSQGAMIDVRQLTASPVQGDPNRLKGRFTVDCAYSREDVESQEQGEVQPELNNNTKSES